MSSSADRKPAGRLQIVLVALVFALPLLAAVWLYYGSDTLQPAGRTNHGILIQPPINLAEQLGESPLLAATQDSWAMVYVASAPCEAPCRDALFKQRQTRLMLGNDMSRVVRVLLHGSEPPDTLFLDREHAGLVAVSDPAVTERLVDARPRDQAPGGFYLLDPLSNVVMYFPADMPPGDLVEDLEHLLDLSRIG